MSKAITITQEDMTLLKEASEMFNETGCVPGIDGEQVPAENIVPDVKEYISETINDPEAIYEPEIWDGPYGSVMKQRGVSILSWSAYFASALLWLWFGIRQHDRNIYLPCLGWIALDGAVIAGAVVYG